MFKEMFAFHVYDRKGLENKITDLKEMQETDMQVLKESYEEQLKHEDEKYVRTEKDLYNINNDLKT